jgi:hypothetical protein
VEKEQRVKAAHIGRKRESHGGALQETTKVPTLARFQPNRNWAGPQRASEKSTENGNEAALGGIQNQKSKLKIGVLRSKT